MTWPASSPRCWPVQDLGAERPGGRWTRSCPGEATPGAGRRVPRGAAGQGRDGRGDARPRRRRCSPTPTGSRCPGRASTSSAPAATARTPSTSRRWPRSSSPATGATRGQARQPGRVLVLGVGRRARGARGRPDLSPDRVAEVAARGGDHVLLRAGLPPGVAARRRRRAASWASPTAFNFLGPLTNPAQPTSAGGRRAPTRGWRRSWPGCSPAAGTRRVVFRGDDGLDELTISTTSSVWWVRGGQVRRSTCSTRARWASPRRAARDAAGRGRGAQRRRWSGRARRRGRAGARRRRAQRRAALALAVPDRRSDTAACAAAVRAGMDRAERAIDDGAAHGRGRPLGGGDHPLSAGLAGDWSWAGRGADVRPGAAASGGWLRRRRGRGEGRLEVVPGVGAERDVGLRCPARRRPC